MEIKKTKTRKIFEAIRSIGKSGYLRDEQKLARKKRQLAKQSRFLRKVRQKKERQHTPLLYWEQHYYCFN